MRYSIELKYFDNDDGGGCRIYVNGILKKKHTAYGCGYERNGAALGSWVTETFQPQLQSLFYKDFDRMRKQKKPELYTISKNITLTKDKIKGTHPWYGISVQKTTKGITSIVVNGETGMGTVERILDEIGYSMNFVFTRHRNTQYYIIERRQR